MSVTKEINRRSDGVSLLAPAKLNLSLRICGRRTDGYHLLSSLVCFTDWGDRLHFSVSDKDQIICDGAYAKTLQSAGGDTLIANSRDALRKADLIPTNPVRIHITKDIPLGAGLGGGSADAAATLQGLLSMFQCEADHNKLSDIALSLGADVPVCLTGGVVLMEGIGEQLEVLSSYARVSDTPWLVLSHPGIHANTKEVFRSFARSEEGCALKNNMRPNLDRAALIDALQNGDWPALIEEGNDLIEPACQAYPDLADFQAIFYQHAKEAKARSMSGSGACFFALYDAPSKAEYARHALEKAGYWAQACPILIK